MACVGSMNTHASSLRRSQAVFHSVGSATEAGPLVALVGH
jgi:hypothetical protein